MHFKRLMPAPFVICGLVFVAASVARAQATGHDAAAGAAHSEAGGSASMSRGRTRWRLIPIWPYSR